MRIAAFIALMLHTADPVPAPRTVNDQVLGTAEEFATAGPARVCLISTTIDLLAGEIAYLDYLGIHSGAIRVIGRRGTFLVREGDAWRVPAGGLETTDGQHRPVRVYGDGRRTRYLFFARPDEFSRRPTARIWIEGDALGRSRDQAILDRVTMTGSSPAGCSQRFIYGWNWEQ